MTARTSGQVSSGNRILVVDDDPGQRSLLETFLHSQGLPVTTAASGTEALAVLATTPVAMIISDVR
ncbi:MAG TPA: response regulator, partial [Verrucomicrobiae bacterium]|nr:response regulator [Verrucomicrobiae bacterium]